jgi:hypothetical protein
MKICNLCKEEKKLIDTSHIISDFLHKELYDENHRLRKFHPSDLTKQNPKIETPPSASYEGGLLCNKCDNETIGNYETYISNVLKNNLSKKNKLTYHKVQNIHGIKILEIENLNYNKTKLFLLSLLWRAHISTKKEFSSVNLGPYAEKIRLQIFNGIASEENDLQIMIFSFEKEGGFSTFIGSPIRHKIEHTTYYSILILGYVILFHLKENRMSKDMAEFKLRSNGNLAIWKLPQNLVSKFVLNYTGAINNSEK